MQSRNQLIERLRCFSQTFATKNQHFDRSYSPILIYQNLYGLFHELRSSIPLSNDPEIKKIENDALECEKNIRKLAFDIQELNESENKSLFELCCDEKKFSETSFALLNENIKNGLEHHSKNVEFIPSNAELEKNPILKKQIFIDQLSKARAKSCLRWNYSFTELENIDDLSNLAVYDQKFIEKILEHKSTIEVLRRITAIDDNNNKKTFQVKIYHVIASANN